MIWNNHAAHSPNSELDLWKMEYQFYAMARELSFVIVKHAPDQVAQIETSLGLALLAGQFIKRRYALVERLQLVLECRHTG